MIKESQSQVREKKISDYNESFRNLKGFISKTNKSKTQTQNYLKILQENFNQYGLSFLFVMYMNLQEKMKHQFYCLLQKVCLKAENPSTQNKPISICKFFNQIKVQNIQMQNSSEPETIWPMNKRSQKFYKLSNSVYQTCRSMRKKNKFTSDTRKQNFLKTASCIIEIWPKNIFEEMALNRLKQTLQYQYYPQKGGIKSLPYCCSIFLGRGEKYVLLENKQHEHKNYHWPIELASMVRHIKKTIVGFLNSDGGIIYVGMKQEKGHIQPSGILLTKQEVVKFFQWVHELCETIYPLLSKQNSGKSEIMYRENLESLKNRERLEEKSQYVVNQCVAVQYLSIIDNNTYLDCYETTPENFKRLYLIRIKIKPGTKCQTYHLLKDDNGKSGQIECFKRKDATVNKLSLEDFFKFYTERFHEFMNEEIKEKGKDCQCPQIHFNF